MLCIDGYCTGQDGNCGKKQDPACKNICGSTTCKGAINRTPCDLSAQLPGYSGRKTGLNLSGFTSDVDCTDGKCFPISAGYTDACQAICGKSSCSGTVVVGPCPLTNVPDGKKWLCSTSKLIFEYLS